MSVPIAVPLLFRPFIQESSTGASAVNQRGDSTVTNWGFCPVIDMYDSWTHDCWSRRRWGADLPILWKLFSQSEIQQGEENLLSSRHLKEETYELNRSTCISISRLLAFTQIRLLIVVRNANDWYSYLPRRATCVATGTGFSNGGFCVARRYGGFYRYLGLMLAWIPVVSYYYYVLPAVIKYSLVAF